MHLIVLLQLPAVPPLRRRRALCEAAAGDPELLDAGAAIVTGAQRGGGQGYCFQNTLLRTTGDEFIADPEKLQTEIFGNGALVVTASGPDQMAEICTHFEVRPRAPPPHSPVV